MGTPISRPQYQGLVLQDERVTHDNLRSKTEALRPSVYSQLDPRPGLPAPQQTTHLTLETSHEQSEDGHLVVRTQRAGHPRPEEAGYVWLDEAAGDEPGPAPEGDWKGWDGYQAITGFHELQCTNTIVDYSDLNIIRLQSGNMLISGRRQTGPSNPGLYHYDVDTAVYSSLGLWLLGPLRIDIPEGPGLVQLPTGRVLYAVPSANLTQVDIYYSDEEGTNFHVYSMPVLRTSLVDHFGDAPPKVSRVRLAYSAGEVCMLVWYQESAATGAQTLWDVAQYASDDLGQNFTYVGNLIDTFDTNSLSVRYPKVLPRHGGGFWMGGYRDPASLASPGYYFTRTIPSAFIPFLDQREQVVYRQDDADSAMSLGPDNDYGCTWWVDEDGTYFALVEDILDYVLTPGVDGGVTHLLLRSLDAGATWEEWKTTTLQTDDSQFRLRGFDADCSGAKTICVTRWTDAEEPDNDYALRSIAAIYLGGFSAHTLPAASVPPLDDYRDVDYIAWGDTHATRVDDAPALLDGRCWIPIALPAKMGWTRLGTGAGETLKCNLNIITAAPDNLYYQESPIQVDNNQVVAEVGLNLNSAGSLATDGIILGLELGDVATTYQYTVHVRFSSAGFAVRDVQGAVTLGTQACDTTGIVHVRAILSKGYVRTWYACDDDITGHVREWREGPQGVVANAGAPAGGDAVYWGHWAAGINDTVWWMSGYSFYPTKWGPVHEEEYAAEEWDNPEDLHPRSHSPLPALLFDRVKLWASSGPTRLRELFDLRAEYDHPITALDPRISPSPNQTWRGEDDTVVELIWDMDEGLGASMLDNIPWVVFALNTNIQAFIVDFWDGAAWVYPFTAQANDGWTNLDYVRSGARVKPDAANTAAAEHYLYHQQHARDTFLFGAQTRPARIVDNTEGAWDVDGTGIPKVKLPRLVLDPAALVAEPPTDTGTGEIWRNNFGILVPNIDLDDMELMRIRIAPHVTADGYYEAGAFVFGAATVFGQPYDNGWKIRDKHNIGITERRDGQRRSRVQGPPRKVIQFGWKDGAIDLCQTQQEDPSPDYVYGRDSGVADEEWKSAYASRNDTSRTVTGFVERAEQANIPVLLLRNIPLLDFRESFTLFSRTLDHVYGRIVDDPKLIHVTGTELTDEIERLDTLTLEEEI